ncbi:hypothetical protein Hamer_G008885 [Homarus americanus]|uniref:Uncharacterized protein n=1 Tax=Homarus americanus TaxID=6706 RepID=A0A8J5JHJ9_HOMAM|nr:hypothetical protein Hamer_G008885 [Homarus americanus]
MYVEDGSGGPLTHEPGSCGEVPKVVMVEGLEIMRFFYNEATREITEDLRRNHSLRSALELRQVASRDAEEIRTYAVENIGSHAGQLTGGLKISFVCLICDIISVFLVDVAANNTLFNLLTHGPYGRYTDEYNIYSRFSLLVNFFKVLPFGRRNWVVIGGGYLDWGDKITRKWNGDELYVLNIIKTNISGDTYMRILSDIEKLDEDMIECPSVEHSMV